MLLTSNRNELVEHLMCPGPDHKHQLSLFRKKTNGIVERSMLGAIGFLRESVSNDAVASRKGMLQICDPRFKCLSMVIVLISVLLSRSIISLTVLYAAVFVLAVFSAIRPAFFLKRTLLFIPVFSLCIVLPALFNGIIPGEPVFTFRLFAHNLSITRQGIDSALIFFLRVLVSVSLTVLLVLTTRHTVILKVLRIFMIPQIFVMTMAMSYRYIFLLLDSIYNTFLAVKSRVGFVESSKTGRLIAGTAMSGLWLRSYYLQARVYDAMLSRGYSGEPQVLVEFHCRTTDYIFLATALLALTGTLWLNHFLP